MSNLNKGFSMKKTILSLVLASAFLTPSSVFAEDEALMKATIKLIENDRKMQEALNDLYSKIQQEETKNTASYALVNQLEEKLKSIDIKVSGGFKSVEETNLFKSKTEDTIKRMEDAISTIQDLKRLSDGSVANALSGPLSTIQKMLDQRLSTMEKQIADMNKELNKKESDPVVDSKIINFLNKK